jgi:flagellar biosynthesis/type III secretory pathway M-ring protein FliF/YscJ
MDDFWTNAIWSVAPTVLIGLMFWFVMRAVVRADRHERDAYARIEAEERAKRSGDQRAA